MRRLNGTQRLRGEIALTPGVFTELIKAEAAKLKALNDEVHRTFAHRSRDKESWQEWEQACEAFHSYESPLDPYIERARRVRRYKASILEFVVCFLEVDPWFLESGYLKQVFLTRLKHSDLDETMKERLRAVLLDAVERRGTREYRYYCRLAAVLADEPLVSALEDMRGRTEGAVASRARVMLETIRARPSGFPSIPGA
jgi:hypothetical protein